ncbi:MAG: recombinase family protein [Oscillospiraceae bacterium]|jgi:site-specific DNA recombinase|nr:recombinase family protein [Oscillospiraceae bacterium]
MKAKELISARNETKDLYMEEIDLCSPTAIYLRVSTEEQAQEGYSIRAQEEKLKAYARIKGWPVYDVYIDPGISGKNITERPDMNRMIDDIKKGHIKNVLVFKIDRLTRSISDLVYLINLFNEYECAFNSLNESIDTHSATGRMFIKIIGIFAEFERENISERVRLGCERKVKEGYTIACNISSYGYDRKNGEKVQTINEKEAVIVREIFEMFVYRHMKYFDIATDLNNRNIPSKKGTVWYAPTIQELLTNCNYIGKVRYATNDPKKYFETKGLHEPIISEELYTKAQNLIKNLAVKVYKKHPKEENYFAGIVFCGVCGGKMLAHGDYKKDENDRTLSRVGYRCQNRYNKSCTASEASQSKIEEAFIEHINSFKDFDTLDEIQLAMKQEIKNQNLDLIDGLKKQLDKLERREKELVNSYIQGDIDLENYKLIKNSIDKEKEQISGTIASVQDCVDEEATIKREHIIKNLKENWEHLSNEEKRQFLIEFVDRVDVVNEKEKGKREGIVKIKSIEFSKF